MSTSKMFSTFLTLIIIMMMIFAGCNISPPAKQGLYGDTTLLTGTMTLNLNEDNLCHFKPSDPNTPACFIKLEFRYFSGDYSAKTSTNELGKFTITLKPPVYANNEALFFIATATSNQSSTEEGPQALPTPKTSYLVFKCVNQDENTYNLISPLPDQNFQPQYYLTLNQEKFTATPTLFILDKSNFTFINK